MKERGMIFNAEMVRAILDGRNAPTPHRTITSTSSRTALSNWRKVTKKPLSKSIPGVDWRSRISLSVERIFLSWRLPFADASFPVVVFDPPHLERVGQSAWMGKKYGRLNKKTWRSDLRAGFKEAFRVLRTHGVLIFKWNETQIPVSQILALTDVKPIIGQRTGKNDKTHWIIFVKG